MDRHHAFTPTAPLSLTGLGPAIAPEDGDTAQMLMLRAAARGGSLVELTQALAAHGGPSLGTLLGPGAKNAPEPCSSAA